MKVNYPGKTSAYRLHPMITRLEFSRHSGIAFQLGVRPPINDDLNQVHGAGELWLSVDRYFTNASLILMHV